MLSHPIDKSSRLKPNLRVLPIDLWMSLNSFRPSKLELINLQFLVHLTTIRISQKKKKKIIDVFREDYKELVHTFQAKDNLISFKELHEKLLNFETFLQGTKIDPSYFLASTNLASYTNNGGVTYPPLVVTQDTPTMVGVHLQPL